MTAAINIEALTRAIMEAVTKSIATSTQPDVEIVQLAIKEETRCCARVFSFTKMPNESFNDAMKRAFQVMRDDPANKYGDRCNRLKVQGMRFCENHVEQQPAGIWNGKYSGKLKEMIDQEEKRIQEFLNLRSDPRAEEEIAEEIEEIVEEPEIGKEVDPAKKKILAEKKRMAYQNSKELCVCCAEMVSRYQKKSHNLTQKHKKNQQVFFLQQSLSE
jgi:hypothetical protein